MIILRHRRYGKAQLRSLYLLNQNLQQATLSPQRGSPLPMGIIRSSFSFVVGTLCGTYIAQNYDVPNIKKLANTALFMAKLYEEKYRKTKKPSKGDEQ